MKLAKLLDGYADINMQESRPTGSAIKAVGFLPLINL